MNLTFSLDTYEQMWKKIISNLDSNREKLRTKKKTLLLL